MQRRKKVSPPQPRSRIRNCAKMHGGTTGGGAFQAAYVWLRGLSTRFSGVVFIYSELRTETGERRTENGEKRAWGRGRTPSRTRRQRSTHALECAKCNKLIWRPKCTKWENLLRMLQHLGRAKALLKCHCQSENEQRK